MMNFHAFSRIAAIATLLGTTALAEPGSFSSRPAGKLLVGGSGHVFILAPNGEITWEYRTALTHDAWMLPSGNILFGNGTRIAEVTPDKKVVFEFKSSSPRHDAVYACQRLPNGNTLVGENATGNVY